MSPMELAVLEQGRVPAQVVLNELREFEASHGDAALDFVADKAGISRHTIDTWLGQERVQSIFFCDADRLFCAMGCQHLWRGQYADYYLACDLRWTRCALDGCEVLFRPKHAARGATGQRFCSRACFLADRAIRTGKTTRVVKRHRHGGSANVCRNGHLRTPENTKRRPGGSIECRVCARETARALYKRSRAAA